MAPWLLSTRLLEELYYRTLFNIKTHPPDITVFFAQPNIVDRFFQIGHTLGAIGHGVFGGIVGVVLAGKRDRKPGESRSS